MRASANLHLQYAHACQLSGRQLASPGIWPVWIHPMQMCMGLPCPVIHDRRRTMYRERNVCLTSWMGKQWSL